jgi:hypothetical protein
VGQQICCRSNLCPIGSRPSATACEKSMFRIHSRPAQQSPSIVLFTPAFASRSKRCLARYRTGVVFLCSSRSGKKVVAAVNVASFSIFLLESLRGSSLPWRQHVAGWGDREAALSGRPWVLLTDPGGGDRATEA